MENWLVTAASRYPFVKTVLWYWIGATEFGVSIFWIVGLGLVLCIDFVDKKEKQLKNNKN